MKESSAKQQGLSAPLLPPAQDKAPQQGALGPFGQLGSLGLPDKVAVGWPATLAWSGFITLWCATLQQLLRGAMHTDPRAVQELFHAGPQWYYFSQSAFATATTLNLINLVFEETPDKQQLALLSAVIKGLSWHSDYLITSGQAIVKFDAHGVLFVPSRYVQWSCSTPTMIFTLSRISNLSPLETASTMAADWLMVAMGWAASELPWPWAVLPLALSFAAFAYVQLMLWRMIHDAMREAGSAHARKCLMFTLGSTLVIWSLFPVAWVAGHVTALPALAALGEPLTMFCNFAAKVVFSTSIMFNNFVTLAQRRRAARQAAEHEERIQAVQELSVAVSRKDAFLAVVGHELRTPLNAICQLASALSLGAAGQVSSQAREWLSTIKASASHLLGVVNDIIMFRANQMGLVIKQEVVPVSEVVDEVLRTLLPSAGSSVTLEKVVHARMPPIVADRRRLVLAITNLVANAIKFMDKQANGRVTVKAYPDRGARHVVIKVVDNGPGLSAQHLAQINDAAHTAQIDAFSRRAGGLGLGLPITFQLAAAHGGVVRVTSPGPGGGTTAILKLPVMQPATDARLKDAFTSAYQSMGYNLEQLLSPELALSEGRMCPAFVHLAPPADAAPAALAAAARSTRSSSTVGTPTAAAAAAAAAMAPAAPPRAPSISSSTGSSLDLSQASNIRATYMWPGAAAAAAAAGGGGGGTPGIQSLDQPGGGNSGRTSQDSLAAWEAYAEHMGYTLPPDGSGAPAAGEGAEGAARGGGSAAAAARGVPGQATALMSTLYMPMVGGAPLPPQAGGGAHHNMVSQQLRQLQQQQQQQGGSGRASGGMGYSKSLASMRSGLGKGSATGSARISIEEGDEEGQESEEAPNAATAVSQQQQRVFAPLPPVAPGGKPALPPGAGAGAGGGSGVGSVRGSIDVVGTPTKLMGAQGARTSDDVMAPQDRTTAQLLESAREAAAAMHGALLSTSSSTYVSSAAHASQGLAQSLPSHASVNKGGAGSAQAQAQAQAPPEPPPPSAQQAEEAAEWEAYLLSGGDPMAPVCRMDAEAVVAANARLSLQYTTALAEAESKGLPLDPTWHAWVARIPDHHKATPHLLQLASQQRDSTAGAGK